MLSVRKGLIDFDEFSDVVSSISDVLDRPTENVVSTLFYEAIQPGKTVSKSAKKFGVTPHVYDRVMEKFYQQTDAFIFELVVSHMRSNCKKVDSRVIDAVNKYAKGKRVLCLGDGIGSDSLRFADAGAKVTYFEFDGPSASFAKHRFENFDYGGEIKVIHNVRDISDGRYDIIINREVLEHVPKPRQIVSNMWDYLSTDGIVVVTESFSRIEDQFPTHLKSNERLSGKTDLLFVIEGFRLVYSYRNDRPLVFSKSPEQSLSRFLSLLSIYRLKSYLRPLKYLLLNQN